MHHVPETPTKISYVKNKFNPYVKTQSHFQTYKNTIKIGTTYGNRLRLLAGKSMLTQGHRAVGRTLQLRARRAQIGMTHSLPTPCQKDSVHGI